MPDNFSDDNQQMDLVTPSSMASIPSPIQSSEKVLTTNTRTWSSRLGFTKYYNYILFCIFGGIMLAFCTIRLTFLDVGSDRPWSFASLAAPGQWYWMKEGWYRVGITLHLWAVIPSGILMVFQFVPYLRRKYVKLHVYNGYVIYALTFLGNIGALMIARRAMGGTVETQSAVYALVILTTTSVILGWYNMRRLQIEEHRAWMLRGMFYLGTIITQRFILISSALIISLMDNYYNVWTCDELAFYHTNRTELLSIYPLCNVTERIVIKADLINNPSEVSVGSAIQLSFGAAIWVAILVHLVGVEIYLSMTPREAERLRRISYQRQLAAGFENPGSAGLTMDRWGDSEPWAPPQKMKAR